MNLSILYRGPLSSCNYDCHYCPFAKRHETAAELRRDREALSRFIDWIGSRREIEFSILFTPWGEALVRPWYQAALTTLGDLPHVRKVAIQTNLSCELDWLAECNRQTVALWCTYHPSQITRGEFLNQCRRLDVFEIRYSVGVVGLRESLAEIELLRSELSPGVYLWINAYKDQPDYYSPGEVKMLTAIDRHFPTNNTRHASLGRHCLAGETVISVDGDGNVRRCHFIQEVIGNLYEADVLSSLRPRPCTNATCGCHIGYVHLPELKQREIYGDGLLERIPMEAR